MLIIIVLAFLAFSLSIILAILIIRLLGVSWLVLWVPLPDEVIERSLTLVDIKPVDTFYDLGSGDGRVIFRVIDKYHIKAIGIELFLPLYFYSRLLLKFNKNRSFGNILAGDVFKKDFSDASIVFCFLIPKMLEKLKPHLKKTLKPGTKIISACFAIPGWMPNKVSQPTPKHKPVYLYEL